MTDQRFRAVTVKQWLDETSKPGEPRLPDAYTEHVWIVTDGAAPRVRFARDKSEGDAKLVEFAFEAARKGEALVALSPENFALLPDGVECSVYDGPTLTL